METLEVIRAAHGIYEELGRVAGAVSDEHLKAQIIGMQSSWKELAYAISARACGMDAGLISAPAKKRGRKRKAEREEVSPLTSHETPGKSGIATTSHTPIAS
jgi:hypothetical protein